MKKSKKIPNEKLGVQISEYYPSKRKVSKFTINHLNKDGTFSQYGVTRKGERFKTKFYPNIKTEKQLNKIFEKAKNKASSKYNITMKTFFYQGRINKKNLWVTKGKKTQTDYFDIKKVSKIKKGKKTILYTNKVSEVINAIESKREDYNINKKRFYK